MSGVLDLGKKNSKLSYDELEQENKELRKMLCLSYGSIRTLYLDDGELQDSSCRPFIDFKRDSVKDIHRSMRIRSERKFEAHVESCATKNVCYLCGNKLIEGNIRESHKVCITCNITKELP